MARAGRRLRLPVARLTATEKLPVGGEGQQGPGVPIHVVFEVEHLGKAGAGDFFLAPGTVLVLVPDEPFEAAFQGRIVGITHGGQAIEDPPGVREGPAGKLYLAYLRDPDGNKICALYRMPAA